MTGGALAEIYSKLLIMTVIWKQSAGGAHQKSCSWKLDSQENTYARVSFLLKFQDEDLQLHQKKKLSEFFQNTFYRTSTNGCF